MDDMITVVTFPDGTQFYKREPFDYSKSRVIADPPQKENLDKWSDHSNRDIRDIRNAKDHAELRTKLEQHFYRRVR